MELGTGYQKRTLFAVLAGTVALSLGASLGAEALPPLAHTSELPIGAAHSGSGSIHPRTQATRGLSLSNQAFHYGATTVALSAHVGTSGINLVDFSIRGLHLCSATVVEGIATCSPASTMVNAGHYPLVATFWHANSSAHAVLHSTLDVERSATLLALSTEPAINQVPENAAFSVTASATSPGGLRPSGAFAVSIDQKTVGRSSRPFFTLNLNSRGLALGRHSLELFYAGNTNFGAATLVRTITVAHPVSNACRDAQPVFADTTSASGGFSARITNFSSQAHYSVVGPQGSATTISPSGVLTVTGLQADASATLVVTTSIPGCQSSTTSLTGSSLAVPDKATLTSITGIAGSYIDGTTGGQSWFLNAYFNSADTFGYAYLNAGATMTLTWHVTGHDGQSLANSPVTLVDNLPHSSPTGTTWGNVALNQSLEGGLAGVTDGNGNVTFSLVNDNVNSGQPPADTTSVAGAQTNESTYPWTNVVLQVGTDVYSASTSAQTNEVTSELDVIVIPAATQSGGGSVNYDVTPAGPLLWSETFTGSAGTLPPSSIWSEEIGQYVGTAPNLPSWNYGTGEIETNTANAANVSTDGNGNLAITALCTTNCTSGNGNWTSARISTAGKVNFQYGQLEARIKLPAGSFNWPAFWMLGQNFFPNQSWPNCGELDVTEGLGGNSVDQATLHANYPNSTTDWNGGGGVTLAAPLSQPISAGFHTFGILWSPNKVQFLLDGTVWGSDTYDATNGTVTQVAGNYTNVFSIGGQIWPFNQPFFIILQDAIPAGTSAANGSVGTMDVSWIKYYSYDGYGAVTN